MAKRNCKGTTRKGEPCKANPLKPGTIIDGVMALGDYCRTHDEDLPASSKLHATRTPEQMGGRPKNPKPSEIARRLIERNELALQRPYWRSLGYDVVIGSDGPELVDGDAPKIYGESKDGDIVVSELDDLDAMVNAAEKLQDRVYGRPKQATEISSPDGGAVVLIAPADATVKSRKAAELLRDAGALDAAG